MGSGHSFRRKLTKPQVFIHVYTNLLLLFKKFLKIILINNFGVENEVKEILSPTLELALCNLPRS